MNEEPTPEQIRELKILIMIQSFVESYLGKEISTEITFGFIEAFIAEFIDLPEEDLNTEDLKRRISTFADIYLVDLQANNENLKPTNSNGNHRKNYLYFLRRLFPNHRKHDE